MFVAVALIAVLAALAGRRPGVANVPPDLQTTPSGPLPVLPGAPSHDGGSILPPGPLPGVPAELQTRPQVAVRSDPAPVQPPVETRRTRVSVQPAELPSSPELRALPLEVRAEGRRLARLAGAAVRAESAAGGRRAPLAVVRAFQGYVGAPLAGPADGKWGRTTSRAARLFAGEGAGMPGAVW